MKIYFLVLFISFSRNAIIKEFNFYLIFMVLMLLTSLLNFLINFLYIQISEGIIANFIFRRFKKFKKKWKFLKFSKPIKIILPCRNIRNMLPRFFTVFILLSVFIAVQMLVQVYYILSRLTGRFYDKSRYLKVQTFHKIATKTCHQFPILVTNTFCHSHPSPILM